MLNVNFVNLFNILDFDAITKSEDKAVHLWNFQQNFIQAYYGNFIPCDKADIDLLIEHCTENTSVPIMAMNHHMSATEMQNRIDNTIDKLKSKSDLLLYEIVSVNVVPADVQIISGIDYQKLWAELHDNPHMKNYHMPYDPEFPNRFSYMVANGLIPVKDGREQYVRNANITMAYMGINHISYTSIAKKYGITTQRVSQIIMRTLRWWRKFNHIFESGIVSYNKLSDMCSPDSFEYIQKHFPSRLSVRGLHILHNMHIYYISDMLEIDEEVFINTLNTIPGCGDKTINELTLLYYFISEGAE